MQRLSVTTLTGRHVSLEPMRLDHVDEVVAAAAGDRSSYGYTQVPDGVDETTAYVRWLLDDAANDRAAPFVQRRRSDGHVVGLSLIHISEPTRRATISRMPSSA